MKHPGDHVDRILSDWNQERPDLDLGPMAVVGRVRRLNTFFLRGMEETWAEFDLNMASFDVLSTLLRAGPPYSLSPGNLIASTMVTSGTMTHRIDQLERTGMVRREKNRDDGRGVVIHLTDRGRVLIEQALAAHMATQAQLVSSLSQSEQDTLVELLRKMLNAFETPTPSKSPDRSHGA